jgi:predicted XRE-type DNA-binding protein
MHKQKEEIKVTVSSGNIYADLGYPNPREAMAKAELAIQIINIIKKRKLTQKKAAELMGIDQPKISAIKRGQLSSFTIDRLLRLLLALGVDIFIETKPHTVKTSSPNIYVGRQSA